jgi:hypothetical protein
VSTITALPVTPAGVDEPEAGEPRQLRVVVDAAKAAAVVRRAQVAETAVAAREREIDILTEQIEQAVTRGTELDTQVQRLLTGLSVQRATVTRLVHALQLTAAAAELGLPDPVVFAVRALEHSGAPVPDAAGARALLGQVAGDSVVFGGEGR